MKNKILFLLNIALMLVGYFAMPKTHADFVFKMGFYWAVLSLFFLAIFSLVIKKSCICIDSDGNEYTRWNKVFITLQGVVAFICLCTLSAGAILLIGQNSPDGTSGATGAVLATMLWTTILPFVLAGILYGKWLKTLARLVPLYFLAVTIGFGNIIAVRMLTQWDKTLCVLVGICSFCLIAIVCTGVIIYLDIKALPSSKIKMEAS